MHTSTTVALAIATLGAGVALTYAPSAASAEFELTVEPPRWLAGCWLQQRGALTVEEYWMAPKGGVMLGMGRTSRGDAVVEYEHTRIYQRGDSLVFHARPSGQTEAEFIAVRSEGESVTFSNPLHDFPQQVSYRRVHADSLAAQVAGTVNGRSRSVDFGYRRVACPGT